jgi:hypothetical protein
MIAREMDMSRSLALRLAVTAPSLLALDAA